MFNPMTRRNWPNSLYTATWRAGFGGRLTVGEARQLDHVPAHVIVAYGRIRIDQAAHPDDITVIGTTADDSALVTATARKIPRRCPGWSGNHPCPAHRHEALTENKAAEAHSWNEPWPSEMVYQAWAALPLVVLATP
jgi:hypothetical protein